MQYLLAFSFLAVLALLAAWDVGVFYLGTPEDTVSNLVQSWSVRWPALPFFVGFTCGHVFWPVR